jgi:hypothetical protein
MAEGKTSFSMEIIVKIEYKDDSYDAYYRTNKGGVLIDRYVPGKGHEHFDHLPNLDGSSPDKDRFDDLMNILIPDFELEEASEAS